jgi:hypothetical protein
MTEEEIVEKLFSTSVPNDTPQPFLCFDSDEPALIELKPARPKK